MKIDQEKLDFFQRWFQDYVRSFYSSDPHIQKNIRLKEEHTWRVVDNSVRLAEALQLDTYSRHLAYAIGLFHDIGRFQQFSVYRTYRDGKSENHARMGLKILEETGLLNTLEAEEWELIEKAISYHNVCNLPSEESERVLLFSKLIRDADKLDSLGVIIHYFENRHREVNEAVEDYPDLPEYSQELVEDILHNRNISYGNIKTVNDMKLTFLAWILDVNFPFTIQEMERKGYLQRLMSFLPQTEDMEKVRIHLQLHMERRKNSDLH